MKRFDIAQVQEVAKYIIEHGVDNIFLFYGEMGVGKTTLIKEIIKQLEIDDLVSSPTFSLVNEYQNKEGLLVYHFDFYRIEDEVEALDIGLDEYFESGATCFVEWPEKVKNLLPLDAVEIHLSLNNDGSRSLLIK